MSSVWNECTTKEEQDLGWRENIQEEETATLRDSRPAEECNTGRSGGGGESKGC